MNDVFTYVDFKKINALFAVLYPASESALSSVSAVDLQVHDIPYTFIIICFQSGTAQNRR